MKYNSVATPFLLSTREHNPDPKNTQKGDKIRAWKNQITLWETPIPAFTSEHTTIGLT